MTNENERREGLDRKPNVLLIFADQLRHDALGCYGNRLIDTPNLDALASDAILFKNAYATCPTCIPSRACCLTGKNQWNLDLLGMGFMQGHMRDDYDYTIAGLLTDGGYVAEGVGKMHFHPQRAKNGYREIWLDESGRVESKGFKSDYAEFLEAHGKTKLLADNMNWNGNIGNPYPYDENLHPTVWTADKSIERWKNRDATKPLFLTISFARPHSPYDPPKRLFDRYMERDLKRPVIGEWAKTFRKPRGEARTRWCGAVSEEHYQRAKAGYYGSVAFIDEQIGRIVSALKQEGEYDNTMILFLSDHGDMLGDHYLWRKSYAYEGSAHIPFLLKTPGNRNRGQKCGEFVTLYDVLPTILGEARLPIPSDTDGLSVIKLADGTARRAYLHGEHCKCYSYKNDMQYLLKGEFKYIWLTRAHKEQLFRLAVDPNELHDLSEDAAYREKLIEMRTMMADLFWKQRGIRILRKDRQLKSYRFKKAFNRMKREKVKK